MPYKPNKVTRPWVKQTEAFARDRTNEFDYNGRPWRKVRLAFLSVDTATGLPRLCVHCAEKDVVTIATVADHNPTAKHLIAHGLDPYDVRYLQGLCKPCHNAKSGRDRHTKP